MYNSSIAWGHRKNVSGTPYLRVMSEGDNIVKATYFVQRVS